MKLKEGLQFSILSGNKSKQVKERISKRKWPNSSAKTRNVNVSNMFRGETKTFSQEDVEILCEEMGVSPDFLFGYNKETKLFNHEKNL